MKYIALLRGINVSGHKKIKMAELKAAFEDIGLLKVQTYIQSGNVLFESKETSVQKLQSAIEKKIMDDFGFDVKTIVKTNSDFKKILAENTFLELANANTQNLYVVLLFSVPKPEYIKELEVMDFNNEEWLLKEDVVYLYCRNGYGQAKLNNNLIEKKLKVIGTTRNWKTINSLYEMSQ